MIQHDLRQGKRRHPSERTLEERTTTNGGIPYRRQLDSSPRVLPTSTTAGRAKRNREEFSVAPQEAAYIQGPTSGRLAWGKFWRTSGADEDAIVASARCNFSHCEAEGARRGLLERCRAGARREARSEQATDEEERLLAPLI
jgi:hypothetical protein